MKVIAHGSPASQHAVRRLKSESAWAKFHWLTSRDCSNARAASIIIYLHIRSFFAASSVTPTVYVGWNCALRHLCSCARAIFWYTSQQSSEKLMQLPASLISTPLTSSLLARAPDWPRPRPRCCCCCCRHAAVGTPSDRRQNGRMRQQRQTHQTVNDVLYSSASPQYKLTLLSDRSYLCAW